MPNIRTASRQTDITPSFVIRIDGVNILDLGLTVRSVVVDLNMAKFGGFSVSFAGDAKRPSDISWMETGHIGIGKAVSITVGNEGGTSVKMISGKITDIAADFPSDGTPTMEIVGDDSDTFVPVKKRRQGPIALAYGRELVSFTAETGKDSQIGEEMAEILANKGIGTLSATKNERRLRSRLALERMQGQPIVGFGECVGDPTIVPGRTVSLAGLGGRFSGQYQLTGTVHAIDDQGYRTTFMAGKGQS